MPKSKNSIDQETIAVYDNQAEDYAALTKDTANETLLAFIQRLAPKSYVLDLGCGPADASATMRRHGLEVDPVDASAEMVRLANERYDIGARQAAFSEINSADTYDGVWASFSLLHAPAEDLPKILAALNVALKPEGWFHLTMKLGKGATRDKLGRFYSYYSQEELATHLTMAAFDIKAVQTGEALSLAGVVEPWIMFTSQKKMHYI